MLYDKSNTPVVILNNNIHEIMIMMMIIITITTNNNNNKNCTQPSGVLIQVEKWIWITFHRASHINTTTLHTVEK